LSVDSSIAKNTLILEIRTIAEIIHSLLQSAHYQNNYKIRMDVQGILQACLVIETSLRPNINQSLSSEIIAGIYH
jgi:hypothetical protein